MLSFKTLIHFSLIGLAAAQSTRGTNVNAGNDDDGGEEGIPIGPIFIGGWVVGGFIAMVAYHFNQKKQQKMEAAQKAKDEAAAVKDKAMTDIITQLSREVAELKSISQATFTQLSKVDMEAAADAAVNGHPATTL